eukprot:3406677-Rhodomonas_salina.1
MQLQVHSCRHRNDDPSGRSMQHLGKGVLEVLSLFHFVSHHNEPDLAVCNLTGLAVPFDVVMEP